MHVHEVSTAADMRRFVYFPRDLYRLDPCWAPPLWMDERRAYSARTNAILAHSDYSLILAEHDGRVVGRSLVYIDHAFNAYYGTRTGFFGAFECIEDFGAARALDDAAVSWLRTRGMNRVRGPIHPVAESWGFLLDGFDMPPVFMAPYNPEYYNEFAGRLGYAKAKDLLAFDASTARGYRIPDRFLEFSERRLAEGYRADREDALDEEPREGRGCDPSDLQRGDQGQLGLRPAEPCRVPGNVPQAEADRGPRGHLVR